MSWHEPEYEGCWGIDFERPVTVPYRKGIPEVRPYTWQPGEAERCIEVMAEVRRARERAREVVRAEIRQGCWWLPAGFTEADLDRLEY